MFENGFCLESYFNEFKVHLNRIYLWRLWQSAYLLEKEERRQNATGRDNRLCKMCTLICS